MTAPLRFVGGILAVWVGLRVAMTLVNEGGPGEAAATRAMGPAGRMEAMRPGPVAAGPVASGPVASRPVANEAVANGPVGAGRVVARPVVRLVIGRGEIEPPAREHPPPDVQVSVVDGQQIILPPLPAIGPAGPDREVADTVPRSRWSGDAYVFLRRQGPAGLAPGAQLGGGQGFARLSYRLDEAGRRAATARVSRATGVRQSEAAVGLRGAIAPGVAMTVERRIALDAGGRSAWAAFAAAGVAGRTVGPVVVDGYAQAGLVGARRRDMFVDGAMRAGRAVGVARVGLGLWGAAQPGAARLDGGPYASVRLPAGLSLAVDWRVRVAGDARPGSGLAMTVAAGF